VYIFQRSLSERSGTATLSMMLTAGLLGAVAIVSSGVASLPAGESPIQVFDISAEAPDTPAPAPLPEPAVQEAARPTTAPASPAPLNPEVAPEPARVADILPTVSPIPVGAGAPAGPPAGAASGAPHAEPATTASRPAPAESKAVERRDEVDPYGRTVFREIRARQSYPAELARAGLAGTVVVQLWISSRGRILAVAIAVSSEIKLLDQVALRQVQSTPLPPPPRGEPRSFRIPMTYRTR
jgi:TonB family protein